MSKKKKKPGTPRELERRQMIAQGRWMGRGAVHKSRKKYDRKGMKKDLRQEDF